MTDLAEMDPLVADARRQLAELLLRRITARVRNRYPDAAALRVDDDVEPTGAPVLLAVLDAAGKPLPNGSPAMVEGLSEDLTLYLPLAQPTRPLRIPLAAAR